MKKSNLLTTAAAVMLLTAAPVWAQTCIKTPSCADLGYTKTAADCSGKTILKCPLDNTQVYCPGYEESLKTYSKGDIYYDERGIGMGTVFSVDSTHRHGIVGVRSHHRPARWCDRQPRIGENPSGAVVWRCQNADSGRQ